MINPGSDPEREPGDVLLSICIATYNRGHYIAETLRSIVDQLDDRVELVIVDGASSDDTVSQIEVFSQRHPQLRFYRESSNSGVDRDFDKAVGYARGRYVWLMTDDDLCVPHAVETVLSAARQDDDLIVLNAEVANADFSMVLNKRLLNIDEDVTYRRNHEQLFVDAIQCLTFIGATVIKRDLWVSRERETYYGSLFIHVGVIFQSPPIERIRIIAEPLVRIRYGNAMWTPRSFEIWMFKWPRLIWSFSDYDEATKARVTPAEPWRDLRKLFHFRSKNAYTRHEYAAFFANVPELRYRLLARWISVFPVFLANLLALLYLALKHSDNLTPIYDLVNNQPLPPLRRWLQRAYKF